SALNNLKLNFFERSTSNVDCLSEDIYAKVLEKSAAVNKIDPVAFHLRFTAKPPAIAAQLKQLYQAASQGQ
ncbi:MAG: hypothetical protein AAFN12_10205, partial [Cyanobacteria bacterium J06560_2]